MQMEDPAVVVMDNGSYMSRAGLSGCEAPDLVVASFMPKREQRNEYVVTDVYLGQSTVSHAVATSPKYPIDRGVVKNWDDLQSLWNNAFIWLNVEPRDHPVIVSEPILNPKVNRERMIELMMETFEVPSFFVALQTILSLYASGHTTGVVLEIGEGVLQLMPFYDGYPLPRGEQRLHFGGRDLTEWMRNLLDGRGHEFSSWAQREVLREVKEQVSYVAVNPEAEALVDDPVPYTLPNGRSITLGMERWIVGELLFRPHLNGFEHDGIDKLVFESIMTCPIDLRRGLYGSVIPSGGATLFPNLPERLENGIRALAPPSVKVRVTVMQDRHNAAWFGGSVLARLPMFSAAAITSADYREVGPGIAHQRCFACC